MTNSIYTAPVYKLEELNNLFIEMTAKNCNQRCGNCYIDFPMSKNIKDFISIDRIKEALNDTKTENLYGAEALVRWEHEGRMVPPSEFIPLFEKNKFILQLDLYIFEQVCSDIKMWKEQLGVEPVISVNISRAHFLEDDFLKKYMLITSKYGINTNKIDFEITESATIEAGINIIEIMRNIKKLGFLISIDDFGTGYSSLSTIQDMPADILKIDKSFVDGIGRSEKNIIDYILTMAKELNLMTIAEGVETKEQRDYLLARGCDIIQGYYYAKPMPKDEFEGYLKQN